MITGDAAMGRRLRLERLAAHPGPWLSVAAPVALLVIGLASFSPALVTQDFWLALVSGREVAEHGLPHLDHLTVMVDQEEVAHPDVAEVHPERVDPEVVGHLGVAGGDVAGDAFVEAELGEQPERRRQPDLAVLPFLLNRVERGRNRKGELSCCHAEGRYVMSGPSGPNLT